MSLNCQTKDAFSKSKAGGWRYDIVGLGMKINMADVNAAIGLAQIREYPELLKERKGCSISNRKGLLIVTVHFFLLLWIGKKRVHITSMRYVSRDLLKNNVTA